MTRKLYTACLGTETNSYSPIPTGLDLFARTMLVRNGQFDDRVSLFGLPLIVWRDRAHALGWEVVQGLAAFATPAGETTRQAYESLRDEILAELKQALPVDIVILNLHGAMVADGYPDAEGDLLTRVRELIGPHTPLLAELDLHGHQTQAKLDSADVLIYFKEYPHIDAIERAHELFDIAEKMVLHGTKPTMAMHDCKMLGIYPTTREPLKGFIDKMKSIEEQAGVLSVSLVHGFPWSNCADIGTKIVVVTDADQSLAEQIAGELGSWVWQHRREIIAPFVSMQDAIEMVVQADAATKPFVLADTADNTGLGAAGDSTYVLQTLIENNIGGFAIAPLWDPVAVSVAFDAGLGANISMRIGGKLGPASGQPIDCAVTIMGLRKNVEQNFAGGKSLLGDVAWLRLDNATADTDAIDIIINSNRTQAFDPVCFSAAGLDPLQKKALVVKSTQHFHAGFAPIARDVIYMATPGSGPMAFADIAHSRLKRKLWPAQDDPHL